MISEEVGPRNMGAPYYIYCGGQVNMLGGDWGYIYCCQKGTTRTGATTRTKEAISVGLQ